MQLVTQAGLCVSKAMVSNNYIFIVNVLYTEIMFSLYWKRSV